MNKISGDTLESKIQGEVLTEENIRGIVIELKKKGLVNRDMYKNERLKGIPKKIVYPYPSHWSRGSYGDML